MLFTRNQETGAITVDHWDAEALWSLQLIPLSSSTMLWITDDLLSVTVENGLAHYRIVGRDEHGNIRTVLEESELNR